MRCITGAPAGPLRADLAEEIDHCGNRALPVSASRCSGRAAAALAPVAIKILRQLVLAPEPAEFVSELMLPFTYGWVRSSDDRGRQRKTSATDSWRLLAEPTATAQVVVDAVICRRAR